MRNTHRDLLDVVIEKLDSARNEACTLESGSTCISSPSVQVTTYIFIFTPNHFVFVSDSVMNSFELNVIVVLLLSATQNTFSNLQLRMLVCLDSRMDNRIIIVGIANQSVS